jgi:light-regulated signal transduction histidine kinase (bacteriophytochrome)
MDKKPSYKELENGVRMLTDEALEHRLLEKTIMDSSERIKFFAYSISHDLKSPVISLYSLTKRLQKDYADILDEKGLRYCDHILKTAGQIAALVEQINVFIITKETPVRIEKISLKEILKVIREEFSPQLTLQAINWQEPALLPEINADRLCIIRAIRNIIDNALKYGGEALTEINIKYKESDKFHILSVKDDGIGLRGQDSSRDIFAPFIRRGTSRGIQGSGLGLNILKEIAEKHEGTVWLEPGRERDVTFYKSISKYL